MHSVQYFPNDESVSTQDFASYGRNYSLQTLTEIKLQLNITHSQITYQQIESTLHDSINLHGGINFVNGQNISAPIKAGVNLTVINALSDSLLAVRDEHNLITTILASNHQSITPPLTLAKSANFVRMLSTEQQHAEIRRVAVGGALTTATGNMRRQVSMSTMQSTLPFFTYMLPSFCLTASAHFEYHFYFAYDFNDKLLQHAAVLEKFKTIFRTTVDIICTRLNPLKPFLHLIQCQYYGKPAWSQNDAMMEAYRDGMDYFYR